MKCANFFLLVFTVVSMTFLSACAPRGETKSLDEVLQIAKYRYEDAATKNKLDSKTQAVLEDIKSHLSTLEEKVDETKDRVAFLSTARAMDSSLRELILHVGYTTRPAFSEIISQYDNLAFADGDRERVTQVSQDADPSRWEFSPSSVKLLVARTYTLLAQELETSKFQVKPRAGKV